MYRLRRLKSQIFTALSLAVAAAVFTTIAHILLSVAVNGVGVIARAGLDFFIEPPPPPGGGLEGGIGPALAGTVILVVLSALLGVPLAVLTAVFLAEFPHSRFSRLVKLFTNSLLEIPTVLVGMLVYVTLVTSIGSYSILAGAIALSIVLLPYTSTYVERALDMVPATYKEAGYSIGLKKAQVVWYVTSRIARRGIAAGILIGLAKAAGETAPLLFTLGGALYSYPTSPASLLEPGNAIPLLIFTLTLSPYENWHSVAWGAALVLTLMVLGLILAVRIVVKEVKV